MADGKQYWSYEQVHSLVKRTAAAVEKWSPDVILAIGGGGFLPARMLRTFLHVPILAVGLELYDDNTNTPRSSPIKTQWFDETSGSGKRVRDKRVLIVDEVDDTRTTLAYCVEELLKTHSPKAVAVMVLHNKKKDKRAQLPPGIQYFAGTEVEDEWCVYPWDALDIVEHTRRAHEQRPMDLSSLS